MTAIVGVFGLGGSTPPADVLGRRMLGAMAHRGADRSAVWHEGSALLGVARQDWEMGAGFSGPVLAVQDGDVVVVADASLYYRDDLRRRLAGEGIRPAGQTASHLILAAYRAWGDKCAEHLEGDFAFILWDRRARRALGARDFAGKRALHYAELADGTLVVASTIGGVLAHPSCPDTINLPNIAETMAAFVPYDGTTCYSAIRRVDGGMTIVRDRGSKLRVQPHWSPPTFESVSTLSFDDAGEQLREILSHAVGERLSPAGPTSVWLSGGRDSTAVYGAGQDAIHRRGHKGDIHAISIQYEVGDSGHEKDYVDAVASHWNRPVNWVNIDQVPIMIAPEAHAANRDEPFTHLYENWNRTLGRGSRDSGARVALDGSGGDQFFYVTDVFFADLFRTGQWRTLRKEWSARGYGGRGFRTFFRWAMLPILPSSVRSVAQVMRGGKPLRGELFRRTPEWIDHGFARTHHLAEYIDALPARRRGESVAAAETRWHLIDPFFPMVFSKVSSFGLQEGVESRSPLYDRRVIDFAATRPREERVTGRETKRLLIRAMTGLLPDSVLAPRQYRTGTMAGYFDRWLRRTHGAYLVEQLQSPLLAELGVVDMKALSKACTRFIRRGEGELGHRLFLTLQADLWLRARLGDTRRSSPAADQRLAAVG